jgi:predicted nucleotidyltransferase
MIYQPAFPTKLHQNTAEIVRDFFLAYRNVDTVLLVNSCARGHAVAESDLDFAILVRPETTKTEIEKIGNEWLHFSQKKPDILMYKQSNQFAHLHLDIIDGKYQPIDIEIGEPLDAFELEIGNQIAYSAPMGNAGDFFKELQNTWLPYYAEELRLKRLTRAINACEYDLNHIPLFMKRGLYFQAFDILYKAFQEYLQAVFIAHKIYPIAYNKWIKFQFESLLNQPELYPILPPILSVSNLESDEINYKAFMLRELLNNIKIVN